MVCLPLQGTPMTYLEIEQDINRIMDRFKGAFKEALDNHDETELDHTYLDAMGELLEVKYQIRTHIIESRRKRET
jgi:hypothetical protein